MKRSSKLSSSSKESQTAVTDNAKKSSKMNRTSSFSDYDTDNQAKAANSETEKKVTVPKEPITLKKVISRSITASFLALLYLSIVWAGHFYCILAVVISQTELYREIVNVRYVEAKERAMPWFRTLQWGWFVVAMILVYGETIHRFCSEHRSLNHFLYLTENYTSISYVLYWMLFITSVLSLKPSLLRFQLSQHMWSVVTVCLVVFQCKYFPSNILNGIFWFFFPMATVIMNDVSAYFVGITFGKKFISTPFLSLSPNKTWEGFIGAFLLTMIFSFFFSALLAQFSWCICPAETIQVWPLPAPSLTCNPNPVFIPREYDLPLIGKTLLYPIQWHGLAYGLFSSLVAPFGGFFASAIKRAYNKKDFDSFLPSHGGLMDRMDCQLLMLTFNSFYYGFFIAPKSLSLDRMLLLISALSAEDKMVLWKEIGNQIGMANA